MSTQARILNAAIASLRDLGESGASAREIASRAGANVSLINYYWGSKEALLRDAAVEAGRRWLEPVMAIARERPADGGLSANITRGLQMFLDSLPAASADAAAFLEAVCRGSRDDALAGSLARSYDGLRDAIAAHARESGGIAPEAAARLATDLIALADGWMIQWLMDGRRPTADRVAELAKALVEPAYSATRA